MSTKMSKKDNYVFIILTLPFWMFLISTVIFVSIVRGNNVYGEKNHNNSAFNKKCQGSGNFGGLNDFLDEFNLPKRLCLKASSSGSDPNLIGWWRFDESYGNIAYDSSGNHNDGQIEGDALWCPNGSALSFTQPNSRVQISTEKMTTTAGSISFWARLEGTQLDYRFLFGLRDPRTKEKSRLQLYMDDGDTQLDMGIGDIHRKHTNIKDLNTNKWYHIALTWNKSDYTVYVNGDETVVSGTWTGPDTFAPTGHIGNNGYTGCQGFHGLIDDVRIWNRLLEPDELLKIYSKGIPIPVFGIAREPSPTDGAVGVDLYTPLSWSTPTGAISKDVYFGTDLNVPYLSQFEANELHDSFNPGTLKRQSTYYWRIDERMNDCVSTGEVWSFTTVAGLPERAENPIPSDSATGVNIMSNLVWTAGFDAVSHDVYFGTKLPLGPKEFKVNCKVNTFDIDILKEETTYYWRIDEKNSFGTTVGDIWKFTTGPKQPSGYIVAWGRNNEGQCNIPRGKDFVKVSGGQYHSLALKSDGSLVAWGGNNFTQAKIPPELKDQVIVDIDCGFGHNMVLKANGTVRVWGGSEKPGPYWRPMWQPPDDLNNVVAIAAGGNHDLVLRSDGSLVAWGYNGKNNTGQVGNTPDTNDFIAIAAGNYHNLALKADGSIVAWGLNNRGQCNIPPQAKRDVIAIAAGSYSSYALKSDGSLIGWAYGNDPPRGNDFVAMAGKGYGSMFLRADGSVEATMKPPSEHFFVAVAKGYKHYLALANDSSPGMPNLAKLADKWLLRID